MGRDFSKFRKYYFGHYHKVEDAEFHRDLTAMLGNMTTNRGSKFAIAAPRGSAKSTIISLEYAIYSICNNLEPCIVLISSTAERASESLKNIKDELESNPKLRKDYPEVCELNVKPLPSRWSQKEIITKNNIKVSALSVGQNIRGKRHNENRPSLIILDDVEGNEMVQNEESRYKLRDWFEKSVLKVGHKETNFIFAGTIHHYGSLLSYYTNPEETPGWDKRIYRSVIKWSDAQSHWKEWSNIFRRVQDYHGSSGRQAAKLYFEAHREEMLKGTQVLWPQNRSYYDLMVIREEEGDLSFDSELQNEPVNPRDCFFNLEEIQFWDDKFPTEEALFKSLKSPVVYAACDPSLGKDKSRGDYTAILTGVKNYEHDILYVLDVDIERRQPEATIETVLSHVRARNIWYLGVETNHFQILLASELKKRAQERNLRFSIEEVEHHKDKIARIQALQPYFKAGKIMLSCKHRLLLDQLKYFPKGLHDDGPDALEMLHQVAEQHIPWSAWL
jgi:predicted phage terminase large subunit-like protein